MRGVTHRAGLALSGLVAAQMLSGCVVVSYRSGGGWFVWPGGLGLLVVLVLLFLLVRRR